jgi:hypothetical protein
MKYTKDLLAQFQEGFYQMNPMFLEELESYTNILLAEKRKGFTDLRALVEDPRLDEIERDFAIYLSRLQYMKKLNLKLQILVSKAAENINDVEDQEELIKRNINLISAIWDKEAKIYTEFQSELKKCWKKWTATVKSITKNKNFKNDEYDNDLES